MSGFLAMLKAVPLWVWIVLATAGVIGYLCLENDHLQDQRDAAREERDTAQKEVKTLNARVDSLNETAKLQRELATDYAKASADYQEKLTDEKTRNDQLSRDVADGKRRLRVNATCVPGTAGSNSSATSRPDGATCELTTDARQGYIDLRRGLADKDAQIVGLQQLANSLATKCFISGMAK